MRWKPILKQRIFWEAIKTAASKVKTAENSTKSMNDKEYRMSSINVQNH